MEGAVIVDEATVLAASRARPRGLRRIWAWLRQTILRAPAKNPTASHAGASGRPEAEPDADAVEPLGAIVREPHAARRREPTPAADPRSSSVRRTLGDVPPLPHVVRELMAELSDPASSARSVARIAASDPTLAASLIRTVNSAATGVRRKITSVAEAVSLLGYSTVRSLVVRMRLQAFMPTRPGQAAYDAEDLWVHSLAVSCAAEALADRVPGVDKGFVSTLGLLHDIGKLAINSYFPASTDAIRIRPAQFAGESFLDRERRVLGADHAEIGAMLAVHWKLPPDLVEAIRYHHDPAAAPADLPEGVAQAAIIVHAANQLAKYCYVYSEDMEIDIVPDALLRRAGLPGPLTRLLGSRVRQAISRAIFFADDTATVGSLGAIRRFLRLAERPALPSLAVPSPARHEPRVAWADDDWADKLAPGAAEIDCAPASTVRLDRAVKAAARQPARLTSRCTAGGVERLLNAALEHQAVSGAAERDRLAARFVLRRLLPNLSEIAAAERVEVVQAFDPAGGVMTTAIRSPALRFAARFGPGVDRRAARAATHAELANVLNLRWFTRVMTPRDGGAMIFVSQAAAE